MLEEVKCYKILGTFLSNYIVTVLHRASVSRASILTVYLNTIRPLSEYTVPVWQSIPDFLADVIQLVKKRHLR